jgi:outer membrane receptor protein involved in Fe transport
MKKIVVTLSVVFLTIFEMNAATLSGKVIDAKEETPIEFANVVLTAPKSKIPVGIGVTDSRGYFNIKSLKKGKYSVKIQFVGYITAKQAIELTADSLNMNTIRLLPNQKELAEVEVVAQASQMTVEPDKKVFKIDQNITTAGGSITDALKNIPSVTVDNDGNVSLRKDGNVQILIDGRPSGLTADNQAQVLQQIPAESVEAVEVITSPSAKYDAENSAGVINIVMKQNRKAGFNGSLSAGASYPQGILSSYPKKPSQNYGFNLNFNVGKIDGFATIGERMMNNYSLTTINNSKTGLDQTTNNYNYMQGLFIRAGINYHINKKHTISISGFGIDGGGSQEGIQINNIHTPTDSVIRNTQGTGKRPSINYNLDYKFDINKNTQLTAGVSYSSHQFNMENGWRNHYTGNDSLLIASLNNIDGKVSGNANINEILNNDISQWIYKADFNHKFNEKSKIEAGWSSNINSRLSTSSAYDYLAKDSISSYYNKFEYSEQIHAGYATYSDQLGNFKYQVGLRAEDFSRQYTNTQKNIAGKDSTGSVVSYSRFDLFPSAYLSYTLANKDELQLNFSRKTNRPRGRQINPFRDYSNPMYVTFGNADLNPEISNGLEFNYIKNWSDNMLNITGFYRVIENQIQNAKWLVGETTKVYYNSYFNSLPLQKSGLELISKNTVANIISLTTSASLYHNYQPGSTVINSLYSQYQEPVSLPNNEWWSVNASILANVLFNKTLSGQIVTKYVGRDIQGQNQISDYYTMDIGLRQSFLHRMVILAFTVNDVLNTQKLVTNTYIDSNKPSMTTKTYMNERTFGAQLIINFGNMKPKKEEMKKRMDQMQDTNDQGGGGMND